MILPSSEHSLGVVPILIGPLALLWSMLPAILLALGGLLLSIFSPSGAKKIARFFWQQKLFTLGIIAVVWLIFWGPDWTFLHGHSGAGTGGGTDWSAFRGGPLRQAAAPGEKDPTIGKVIWTYDKYPMVYSSPAITGDRLYFSTIHLAAIGSGNGAIECLDAKTGKEIWRYSHNYRETFSSPSVAGDYLVCGEGVHTTRDAYITCLDVKQNGKLLWQYQTNYHVESSPCIVNGRAYIGAGHDGYYCIELKPESQGKAHVLWHLIGPNYHGCESCPIVVDGVMYCGLGNEGQAVLGINAETGAELWRIPTHYPVFGPPTVAEGKLYIGMGNGDFINDADAVRKVKIQKMKDAGKSEAEIAEADKWLGPGGEIWCIDLKTRNVDWKFRMDKTALGCLAYADGKLYFGSTDGYFYCLSKEGKLVRKFNVHEPVYGSAAVGTEHAYFATKKGRLFCLNLETLKPVWDIALGSGDTFLSSPSLALDHVYVGTMNDGLRCIGAVGAPPPPQWTGGDRGGATEPGAWASRGEFEWRYPGEDDATFEVTAPLMPFDGYVYAGVKRGGAAEFLKLKLDHKADDAARVAWRIPFAHGISIAPAGVADQVFIVDGSKDDTGRALHAMKAETGAEQWHADLEAGASGNFSVDPRHLVIWSGPRTLSGLATPSGARQWSYDAGPGLGSPVLIDGLVVATTGSELMALDDQTGALYWRVPVNVDRFGPACAGTDVVLATGTGLEVRSLQNGAVRWSKEIGACGAPPIMDEDRVAATTAKGDVYEFRLADGAELAHRTGVEAAVPPFFATSESTIYHSKKDLSAIGVDVSNPTTAPTNAARWYGPTDWLGEIRTPLAVLNQRMFFATSTKGIVCLRPRKQ